MIRLPISALEPGMVLAAPIPHPAAPDQVLLNSGYRLEARILRELRRFPVYVAWIQHPGFDFLDERVTGAIPRSRMVLYETVKKTFTGVAARTAGTFDLLEYRTVIGNMIFSMVANKNHAVWAERIMQGEHELFGHSANVAYLSLLIGMRIKGYLGMQRRYVAGSDAEDMTNLGIGAMFHDFGKLSARDDLRARHIIEKYSDEQAYRDHAEKGFRALRGRIEATAAAVVLHHHQRFDGMGFPPIRRRDGFHRLEGRHIHVFARVTSVANVLDALISRCQKKNRPLIAALVALTDKPFAGMFDPVVAAAALRCVPPFALGTCLGLSDGREAVVTDLNPSEPCHPIVRVVDTIATTGGSAGDELDLAKPGAPTITQEGGRPVARYVEQLTANTRQVVQLAGAD